MITDFEDTFDEELDFEDKVHKRKTLKAENSRLRLENKRLKESNDRLRQRIVDLRNMIWGEDNLIKKPEDVKC